ncbi:hypothetical protein Bbelb_052900 [Branchiostoma belcheri]|nr:hypothetical protein Bbelb_052900 [Branchiostoma belcheri]
MGPPGVPKEGLQGGGSNPQPNPDTSPHADALTIQLNGLDPSAGFVLESCEFDIPGAVLFARTPRASVGTTVRIRRVETERHSWSQARVGTNDQTWTHLVHMPTL